MSRTRTPPRDLTPEEVAELAQTFVDGGEPYFDGMTLEKVRAFFAEEARCVAFDNYITGGPGYTGIVILILWDGSPVNISSITRNRDGKLEIVSGELGS